MRRLTNCFALGIACALSATAFSGQLAIVNRAPFDSVKSFSDFQQLDSSRLINGEIFSERGSLMDFPNGISAQTCFVVPLSAEETAKKL